MKIKEFRGFLFWTKLERISHFCFFTLQRVSVFLFLMRTSGHFGSKLLYVGVFTLLIIRNLIIVSCRAFFLLFSWFLKPFRRQANTQVSWLWRYEEKAKMSRLWWIILWKQDSSSTKCNSRRCILYFRSKSLWAY